MDVYYVKQMTGQFDLALAGISGGTLDPAGFMECFCDDNRSGLFLNHGLDSHNPNILIDLGDVDGDGVDDGPMYWSFDASILLTMARLSSRTEWKQHLRAAGTDSFVARL